jgi:flavin reductase (DIM6/NTAB) family NADH-FMN oxidoreductase RutF
MTSSEHHNLAFNVKAPDSTLLRSAWRRFAATVCIVAVTDDDGQILATTVSAVSSICFDPPTLLVCLNRSGAITPALATASAFSVNVLGEDQAALATLCAGGAPHEERARHFEPSSPPYLAPRLPGAPLCFVCQPVKLIELGTHVAVFGEITDLQLGEATAPLLYLGGTYGSFCA